MAHDNGRLRSIHLFAGAGGGILADLLLGHRPVCAVEIEDYPRRVLLQRQRDGILPEFPIWDDVQTFDGKPWRGIVHIVAGGFPCQDISAAGKGAGLAGKRSGLWSEMARVVSEVRPRFVFVENSPRLVRRGLDVVLSDLAALGFNARWGIVGANHAGAPQRRERMWIVANAGLPTVKAKTEQERGIGKRQRNPVGKEFISSSQWLALPEVPRMDDGLADGMDRQKAIGNGQCPQSAALAWRILAGAADE